MPTSTRTWRLSGPAAPNHRREVNDSRNSSSTTAAFMISEGPGNHQRLSSSSLRGGSGSESERRGNSKGITLPQLQPLLPALGLVGAGLTGVALPIFWAFKRRNSKPNSKSPPASPQKSSAADTELQNVKLKVEQLLRSKGMGVESYPHLAVVAVKDNKEIDVVRLENLTSNEGRSLLLAVERTANQAKTKDTGEGKKTTNGGLLSKLPGLTAKKVETTTVASKPESTATVKITGAPKLRTTVDSLEQMGVKVSGVATSSEASPSKCDISWDTFAGYDQQKREIEDTILLALRHPQVYDKISRSTRTKFEPNRPKAMLFEGPPGTGKTSCARVIASQAGIPFLHVPIEAIMSKWFGESSKLLAKIFSLAREFPTGAIIFLDEVDSLGGSRNKGMTHETTRRILSILLRQIDGFEQDSRVVVVAATNRKEDLDPALISRFESSVYFGLPDEQTRRRIAARYAKHLTESELAEFARVTIGMADRDIKDVCLQAERHWASKVIRGRVRENVDEKLYSPPLQEYIESAMNR